MNISLRLIVSFMIAAIVLLVLTALANKYISGSEEFLTGLIP